MSRIFLRGEWRKLLMANYVIDPKVLERYVPAGTEIDLWNGKCYASVIGFMFLETALKGIKVPFHVAFEEVNLRFYVRRFENGQWKRGVVFVKEMVPKPALTWIANLIYREHYETLPMAHSWHISSDDFKVEYRWKKAGRWHGISAITDPVPIDMAEASDAEFITEHFWGYTKITDAVTSEYEVSHPRWQIYPVREFSVNLDFGSNYGKDFAFMQDLRPESVFLAEGSAIRVHHGKRLVL